MPASSLRGTCILCARPIAPADTLAVLANVLSAHVDCTETRLSGLASPGTVSRRR